MTPAQRTRLYWPLWRRARAAGWLPDGTSRSDLASDARDLVEQAARLITSKPAYAGANRERILRHAANAVAMTRRWSYQGRALPPMPDYGSRRMGTLDLMLFCALCHCIADPTWLGTDSRPGLRHWQDPGLLERQIYESALRRRFVGSYIAALSRDIYGTRDIRLLTIEQLRNLYRLLTERPHARPNAAVAH